MNASLMNGILTLAVIGLSGCTSSSQLKLVGLWREDSDYRSAVVLRKADGEYFGKRMQILDVAQPAACVTERGKWWVKGNHYFIKVFEKSTNKGANERHENRRPIKFEVQSINAVRFVYLSTDGAVVTEQKIEDASDIIFNEAMILLPGAVKVQ